MLILEDCHQPSCANRVCIIKLGKWDFYYSCALTLTAHFNVPPCLGRTCRFLISHCMGQLSGHNVELTVMKKIWF